MAGEPDACLGPERKAAISEVLGEKHLYVGQDMGSMSIALEFNGKPYHLSPTGLTLMDLSRLASIADVAVKRDPRLLTPERKETLAKVDALLREAIK